MLPAEARLSIGKVASDTEPVKKMLEEIGFYYTQEVDPFDGGPHYRCPLKDILVIKERVIAAIKMVKELPDHAKFFLIHTNALTPLKDGSFTAIKVLAAQENNHILISQEDMKKFNLSEGSPTTAIPFDFV